MSTKPHTRPATPTHLVVMGVSGCGKSTIGMLLADRTGALFIDADDLHPEANVEKMRAGTPLDDEDRAPWLAEVRDTMSAIADAGGSSVIACSALRQTYREVLAHAVGRVRFVHLDVPAEVLAGRVEARADHFMPASLVTSQLATLETLGDDEDGVVVPMTGDPDAVTTAALAALAGQR
ncbi:gluconokinase [Sanguibacter gelidistatuariae]|uniref:Gluconokinase n=1 Tax=Sanguibacter gelidistatuariae TaxID=1814289 RepID=A0A1G6GZ50_9MICO|nr:gluconokinase [Sanguibacter gelidistatuariae]SDB87302.1 gluconokinase [Sanguibacter gelidistatuariae]